MRRKKYTYTVEDFIRFLNQPLTKRFRKTVSWFYKKRINWKKTRKNIVKPL